MSRVFTEGQKITSITGPWCETEQTAAYYQVGHQNCTSISIVMEPGQMARVPWAIAEYSDKPPFKINLAMMEEVELVKEH